MAKWEITINDDLVPRILNDFATQYNYQEKIQNKDGKIIDNPETKVQFAKKQIIEYVKNVMKAAKANKRAMEARDASLAEDEELDVT